MADQTGTYQATRRRIVDLVSGLDNHAAEQLVPATPEWRIKDIDAFEWTGDPDARRPFAFFRPRPTPLVE